jgi:hypothetical protein
VAEVVRVSAGYRSGLSEDELEELARQVMTVICREWPRLNPRLDSSMVYTRLIEEGVDPPDYAMHDAIIRLDGWFLRSYLGRRSDDQIRVHGGMSIGGVNTDLCD